MAAVCRMFAAAAVLAAALAAAPGLAPALADGSAVPTQRIVVSPKVETPDTLPGTNLDAPDGDGVPAAAGQKPVLQFAPVQVHYGEEGLPDAVKRTRAALIAAARTGDLGALGPVLAGFSRRPRLSNTDDGEALDVLKGQSGDPEGREVLAVLWSVLDAGWVVENKGTPEETYIWPYFARLPIDKLTPPQMVEVFRLVTAGDFEQMRQNGAYSFFRAEIAANGDLKAFLTDF